MRLSNILDAKGSTVHTIHPDALVSGLVAVLAEVGVGALVVSEDGRTIAGIVSERDVVRALATDPGILEQPVSAIMTTEVTCAGPDDSVEELAVAMTEQRVRHVPVLDDEDHLVGIVSIGDVVKSRLDELNGEREALVGYITQGG